MSKLFNSIEDEDEYYKPNKVFSRKYRYKRALIVIKEVDASKPIRITRQFFTLIKPK